MRWECERVRESVWESVRDTERVCESVWESITGGWDGSVVATPLSQEWDWFFVVHNEIIFSRGSRGEFARVAAAAYQQKRKKTCLIFIFVSNVQLKLPSYYRLKKTNIRGLFLFKESLKNNFGWLRQRDINRVGYQPDLTLKSDRHLSVVSQKFGGKLMTLIESEKEFILNHKRKDFCWKVSLLLIVNQNRCHKAVTTGEIYQCWHLSIDNGHA